MNGIPLLSRSHLLELDNRRTKSQGVMDAVKVRSIVAVATRRAATALPYQSRHWSVNDLLRSTRRFQTGKLATIHLGFDPHTRREVRRRYYCEMAVPPSLSPYRTDPRTSSITRHCRLHSFPQLRLGQRRTVCISGVTALRAPSVLSATVGRPSRRTPILAPPRSILVCTSAVHL